MTFLSLPFVVLFTCCLILFYTVKSNYQKIVLLLGSCVFVGYFNIAYLIIAALISAITFYWGRWIGAQKDESKRKRVFVGGILFLVLYSCLFLHCRHTCIFPSCKCILGDSSSGCPAHYIEYLVLQEVEDGFSVLHHFLQDDKL